MSNTHTNPVQFGFTRWVPIIIGVMMMLMAPGMFLSVGFYLYYDSDAPPDDVVTGVVACNDKTQFPVAAAGCFGRIQISGWRKSGKNRIVTLERWTIGSPEIELKVGSETKRVTLPERSRRGWGHCKPNYNKYATLPESVRHRTNRKFNSYSLTEWGIRNNDQILVSLNKDGVTASKLWCGDAEKIRAHDLHHRELGLTVFGAMALIAFLIGLVVIVGWHFAGKRKERSRPDENATPATWIAWTLQAGSATWNGVDRGRALDASRIFRRRGIGSVRISIAFDSNIRFKFVRRSGLFGAFGTAADRAANMTVVDGEDYGFSNVDIGFEGDTLPSALQTDNVKQGVEKIFENNAGASTINLVVRNGKLTVLFAYPPNVTESDINNWLDGLDLIVTSLS